MKLLYFWVIFLGIIGVVATFYLIPTKEEIAFIKLESGKIISAEKYYREQYQRGIRNSDILFALHSLEVKGGNIEGAITLLKEYLRSAPEDVRALKLLAEHYRSIHKFEHYFQALLEISLIRPEKDVLHQLTKWYTAQQDSEKLFLVLTTLIENGFAEEDDYLLLTDYFFNKGEHEKVLSLLKVRREQFPEKVTMDDILLELSTTVAKYKNQGGNPEAEKAKVDLLINYIEKKKDPQLAYNAIVLFGDQYPQYFSYLVSLLEPMIEKNPMLQAMVLQELWQHPEEQEKTLVKILEQYSSDKPTDQIQDMFFAIALERGYDIVLLDIIRNSSVNDFSEREIINLGYWAYVRNQPYLAEAMRRKLGENYLKRNPLIEVALAIGAKDSKAPGEVEKLLKEEELTTAEYFYLIKPLAAAKYASEVRYIGKEIAPFYGLKEDDLVELAEIYVQVGQEKEFYTLLKESEKEIGGRRTAAALIYLDIAQGFTKKAAVWIESQKTLSSNLLQSYYNVAYDKKEYPLALYIAKRMQRQNPSVEHELNYALALIQVGKIDQGVYLLEQIHEKNSDVSLVDKNYFEGYFEAAKKNPKYIPMFKELLKQKEAHGELSVALLRNLGYAQLEVWHDFKGATETFKKIISHGEAQKDDVDGWLFLVGPKISCEERVWLEEYAEKQKGENLESALQNLLFVGEYCAVIEIFENQDEADLKPSSYLAYMEALYRVKAFGCLKELLYSYYCMADDKEIEKLIFFAEAIGEKPIVRALWEKRAMLEPHNPIVWQKLASATFAMNEYYVAKCYLEKFFALQSISMTLNKELYQSYYQYGMVYSFLRAYRKANCYLLQALFQIQTAPEKTFQMQETEAAIALYLHLDNRAICLMYNLYVMAGRDPDVAASLANTMMDVGSLNSAKQVICSYNFLRGSCAVAE